MEDAPLAEIRPNIAKAFIHNLIIIAVIVGLIISGIIFLDNIVGLEVFVDTFREIGIQFSPISLLSRFIFITLFFTALILILNYVALGKTRYTLYADKIEYDKSFFIMQIKNKVIPYANISQISYEEIPLLSTSKIVLELTGMKEKTMKIEYIDDAPGVVKKIQDLIMDFRATYYAKYTQEYRYQHIMDQS